jgi:glycosyltransferase involved in cell wall biosynthesis
MLRRDRVRLIGHVSDLSELYGHVRLIVAPLRYGAGIKGKVLEAFAAGVPCVMTPIAAEGLPLPNALAATVARDAPSFADLICTLNADAERSAVLGQVGSGMVREHFNEERIAAVLEAAIEGKAQSAPSVRQSSLLLSA